MDHRLNRLNNEEAAEFDKAFEKFCEAENQEKQMNRRTKWMKNTRNLIDRLEAEIDKLKQFEDYSYYVGTEVTCGRMPLKYSAWLDSRKGEDDET